MILILNHIESFTWIFEQYFIIFLNFKQSQSLFKS